MICASEPKSHQNNKQKDVVRCIINNTEPTSLVSASFFLFSDPCVVALIGAWWPGSPGTKTLLLALTIGVFTWNEKPIKKGSRCHQKCSVIDKYDLMRSGEHVKNTSVFLTQARLVTLETVVSMERDKLVWTSRVKQTCLSAVLISCTDGKEERGRQIKRLIVISTLLVWESQNYWTSFTLAFH